MSSETKIGLLIALLLIVVVGYLLSATETFDPARRGRSYSPKPDETAGPNVAEVTDGDGAEGEESVLDSPGPQRTNPPDPNLVEPAEASVQLAERPMPPTSLTVETPAPDARELLEQVRNPDPLVRGGTERMRMQGHEGPTLPAPVPALAPPRPSAGRTGLGLPEASSREGAGGLRPVRERTHTVREGESLASIAGLYYGREDKAAYLRIFDANRNVLSVPEQVRPGMVLVIPEWERAEAPAAGVNVSDGQSRLYVVQPGDSLIGIAKKMLDDKNRWREVYDLNKEDLSRGPAVLRIGQVLRLPKQEG